jgi:hypothetical protein
MTEEIKKLYERWNTAREKAIAASDLANATPWSDEKFRSLAYEAMQAEYELRNTELDLAIALQEESGWWEPLPKFERRRGSLEAKIVEAVRKSLEQQT